MLLAPQSIEILLDLLEIKMGCMHVQDRDDAKELLKLRYCRQELLMMMEEVKKQGAPKQQLAKFSKQTVRSLQKRSPSLS